MKCSVFISVEINILDGEGATFFPSLLKWGHIDVAKAVKGPHWGNLIQTRAQFISHDQHTAAQKSLCYQFLDSAMLLKLSWKTFRVIFISFST